MIYDERMIKGRLKDLVSNVGNKHGQWGFLYWIYGPHFADLRTVGETARNSEPQVRYCHIASNS